MDKEEMRNRTAAFREMIDSKEGRPSALKRNPRPREPYVRIGQPATKPVPFRMTGRGKTITMGILLTLVGSVYAYTMSAVSRDDFANIDDEGNRIRERRQV